MSVDLIKLANDPAEVNMPFEVIAYATIRIAKAADQRGYTGRSHSLWYSDAQEKGVFRWYETAFWAPWTATNRELFFALPPDGQNSQLGLSRGANTHQVAWPFTPIDQGEEEAFVEQWLQWFGQAANGQLIYPRHMPEKEISGSWRRGD